MFHNILSYLVDVMSHVTELIFQFLTQLLASENIFHEKCFEIVGLINSAIN